MIFVDILLKNVPTHTYTILLFLYICMQFGNVMQSQLLCACTRIIMQIYTCLVLQFIPLGENTASS